MDLYRKQVPDTLGERDTDVWWYVVFVVFDESGE